VSSRSPRSLLTLTVHCQRTTDRTSAPRNPHDSRERPRYNCRDTTGQAHRSVSGARTARFQAQSRTGSAGPNLTPHQNNTRNAVQVVLDFASGPRLPRRRRDRASRESAESQSLLDGRRPPPPASLLRSPSQPASALRMAGTVCPRMARTSPPARPAHLTAAPASSLDPPAAPYPSPGLQAMWYTNSDHHHRCALRRTCKPPNR